MIFDIQSQIQITTYKKGELPTRSGVFTLEGSDEFEIWQLIQEPDLTVKNLPFAWVKKSIPDVPNTLAMTINELSIIWDSENDFQKIKDTVIFH